MSSYAGGREQVEFSSIILPILKRDKRHVSDALDLREELIDIQVFSGLKQMLGNRVPFKRKT